MESVAQRLCLEAGFDQFYAACSAGGAAKEAAVVLAFLHSGAPRFLRHRKEDFGQRKLQACVRANGGDDGDLPLLLRVFGEWRNGTKSERLRWTKRRHFNTDVLAALEAVCVQIGLKCSQQMGTKPPAEEIARDICDLSITGESKVKLALLNLRRTFGKNIFSYSGTPRSGYVNIFSGDRVWLHPDSVFAATSQFPVTLLGFVNYDFSHTEKPYLVGCLRLGGAAPDCLVKRLAVSPAVRAVFAAQSSAAFNALRQDLCHEQQSVRDVFLHQRCVAVHYADAEEEAAIEQLLDDYHAQAKLMLNDTEFGVSYPFHGPASLRYVLAPGLTMHHVIQAEPDAAVALCIVPTGRHSRRVMDAEADRQLGEGFGHDVRFEALDDCSDLLGVARLNRNAPSREMALEQFRDAVVSYSALQYGKAPWDGVTEGAHFRLRFDFCNRTRDPCRAAVFFNTPQEHDAMVRYLGQNEVYGLRTINNFVELTLVVQNADDMYYYIREMETNSGVKCACVRPYYEAARIFDCRLLEEQRTTLRSEIRAGLSSTSDLNVILDYDISLASKGYGGFVVTSSYRDMIQAFDYVNFETLNIKDAEKFEFRRLVTFNFAALKSVWRRFKGKICDLKLHESHGEVLVEPLDHSHLNVIMHCTGPEHLKLCSELHDTYFTKREVPVPQNLHQYLLNDFSLRRELGRQFNVHIATPNPALCRLFVWGSEARVGQLRTHLCNMAAQNGIMGMTWEEDSGKEELAFELLKRAKEAELRTCLSFRRHCFMAMGAPARIQPLAQMVEAAAALQRESTCEVCFGDVAPEDQFVLRRCGHFFCTQCATTQLRVAHETRNFALVCSAEGCDEPLALKDVAALCATIGPDFHAQLLDAFVNAQASRRRLRPCPTADCPHLYQQSAEPGEFSCPGCRVRLCTCCQGDPHEGLSCAVQSAFRELDPQLQEWLQGDPAIRKACPVCLNGIEKNQGCPHVFCISCGTNMCFTCLRPFGSGLEVGEHVALVH